MAPFVIRALVVAIVFGALQLFFCTGILQPQWKRGPLAQVSGILEVIVGLSFGTVIFVYLGLFLWIPAVIIEVLLMLNGMWLLDSKNDNEPLWSIILGSWILWINLFIISYTNIFLTKRKFLHVKEKALCINNP